MARFDAPSLEQVGAAFGRIAERARSRFQSEDPAVFEERREEDQETVDRWARAMSVDPRNVFTGELALVVLSVVLVLLQIVHEIISIRKDAGGKDPNDQQQ